MQRLSTISVWIVLWCLPLVKFPILSYYPHALYLDSFSLLRKGYPVFRHEVSEPFASASHLQHSPRVELKPSDACLLIQSIRVVDSTYCLPKFPILFAVLTKYILLYSCVVEVPETMASASGLRDIVHAGSDRSDYSLDLLIFLSPLPRCCHWNDD